MKHKSETFEKFKEFRNEVENQRDRKIKFLQSDHGGEYLRHEFGMHLRKCGTDSKLMPPGTPQRNGVSEHRNPLQKKDTSETFWGERNFFVSYI